MLFNSLDFLIFFPVVTLIYFLIPHKIRYIWLLICSYYFYMCRNAAYALLLFTSTAITYASGLAIQAAGKHEENDPERLKSKGFVAISFILNLTILIFFKYTGFIIDNLNLLFGRFGMELVIPKFDILLPVGISFYIFQALSYTVDAYRGDVKVERNFLKYAVFVSFFPQLVAGPIERSSRLLNQFNDRHKFDYDRVCKGLMMMVWGFFQKMVIADRVAVFVNQIFNYYNYYSGLEIFIGMLFFAVQIYCDFAGYSNIALGAAQVMGFDLMQNFTQPYLARSVAEFWKRWHISLTSWFRDYLYIPLGGNRKGKWIKYRNIMIIFLTSGLWHGANWTYVIWGGLNGAFQIVGAQTLNLRKRIKKAAGIREESWSYKMLATVITFLLVDFTWIFFRADNIEAAFSLIRQMFSGFRPWILIDGSLYAMGLSFIDFWIGMIAIAVLLAVDILHSRNVHIREWIVKQNLWFRWGIYLLAVYSILIFGYYGPNFDATQFIYFQF